MDMKKMDVSCFMLFEATGDSEVDGATDAVMMDEQSAVADGVDDAESCCHEESESHKWDVGDQQLGGHKSCVVDAEYEQHEEKKNDEEETCGYGTSFCDDDDDDDDEIQKRHHHHHGSSLSGESGQQLMDEMEKSRRFWEACLAS